MALGIDQINRTCTGIPGCSEANAATSEEKAATSEELSTQAISCFTRFRVSCY
jgi:hypothetical protein